MSFGRKPTRREIPERGLVGSDECDRKILSACRHWKSRGWQFLFAANSDSMAWTSILETHWVGGTEWGGGGRDELDRPEDGGQTSRVVSRRLRSAMRRTSPDGWLPKITSCPFSPAPRPSVMKTVKHDLQIYVLFANHAKEGYKVVRGKPSRRLISTQTFVVA